VTLTEVAAQIAAVQFRANDFALYVDDVWKVTPKLTLSLGLRYENTPPWKDISHLGRSSSMLSITSRTLPIRAGIRSSCARERVPAIRMQD
jgi:outer membrane receptor for monomeric catechols